MDVHPPLAKLLITLSGWLAGFNGDFDFKDIGKDYIEPGVPYVAMRMFPALMGVMLIPMIFLTLKAAGCRTSTAGFGAGLLIFGTCNRTVGRLKQLTPFRKRSPYPVPFHSSRLPIARLHGLYCASLHVLHESTRARAVESLRPQLVVLARCYWSRSRRDR